jgi:hypothetical protein
VPPFNEEQLTYAANHVIDHYLRNKPVDQVNVDRPLITELVKGKKNWGGGLQFVVENLRFSNDSNFQAYFGDSQVTYNRKRTLGQAKYTWGSFHDGFGLNEDELVQNGITMTDDRNAKSSGAERVQLVNLLEENSETLRLGFMENFDIMLHRDGTQDSLQIAGLDHLVSLTPGTGSVVGGIDDSVQPLWVNHAEVGINTSSSANTLLNAMEDAWHESIRRGGATPNFLLAGEDFLEAYRTASKETGAGIQRQVVIGDSKGVRTGSMLDASVGNGIQSGLYFKGIEIMWDPVFDTLDDLETTSAAADWSKRLYMLNTKKHLKLRPISGHWMIKRSPPRVYDRYVHYFALTAKASMTTNKRNANAVITIA